MLAVAAGIHLGSRALADASDPAFLPLIDVGTVIALVLVLVGGQTSVRAAIHRLLFRMSDRRRDAFEAFFHSLPPELGVDECARRALATLIEVMQLRGVALVSDGDHPPIVAGALDVRQITRLWPRAGVPIFPGGLLEYDFTLLPEALKNALTAAEVASILPVASPRRTWGHLLPRTGLLGSTAGSAQLDPVRAFADQLALALDAADVVARALAVERSLAHAEKLAAIGELAARIAHEIRNPVTAARSLAQQLAREPGAPFVAEHEVILAELERVERQVAALLRFARRDEFRFEPVDLAELVRNTVEAFRARLSSAGIDVDVAAGVAVTARADREKLRQVLVNLIENAIDALANGNAVKRLQVSVHGDDGHATVQVSDNGPGVPPDALPHLFEPFFSLKETGTGLGLAIARRTVDAHGGRIAATSASTGVTFVVELPLAGRS
ncbi:MAG TPA: ATP-binding protein [Candidatus Binatia bacterium]|nr:ATP-binding protein [Candidatus Binatia bacterium]